MAKRLFQTEMYRSMHTFDTKWKCRLCVDAKDLYIYPNPVVEAHPDDTKEAIDASLKALGERVATTLKKSFIGEDEFIDAVVLKSLKEDWEVLHGD